MAIFALYKFKLEKQKKFQSFLNFDDNNEQRDPAQYDSYEQFFESFFPEAGRTMTITEEKRKGQEPNQSIEYIPHGNTIEQHRDHIVVFKIQANKTKTINTADWEVVKEQHHPDSRVIIDFREDHCIMAIERKSSVFDPDRAADILCFSFNFLMRNGKIKFTYHRLEKQAYFWDAVNEIRDKFEDAVRKVTFNFEGTETPPKNKAEEKEAKSQDELFTEMLTEWVGLLAGHGQLTVDIEDDEKLKRVSNDLTHMAQLCKNNRNYNLTVAFRDFGIFRYGQDIKAQMGLDDEVIEDFLPTHQTSMVQLSLFDDSELEDVSVKKNSIPEWFDRIIVLFADYGEKSSTKQVGDQSDRL